MLFCKSHCNFNTCKDLVCLLSNLVEHVLIAYGPLGSFTSFVILWYFVELLTTKIQNKSASIEAGLLVIWTWFQARTHMSCDRTWSKELIDQLWVGLKSVIEERSNTQIQYPMWGCMKESSEETTEVNVDVNSWEKTEKKDPYCE